MVGLVLRTVTSGLLEVQVSCVEFATGTSDRNRFCLVSCMCWKLSRHEQTLHLIRFYYR